MDVVLTSPPYEGSLAGHPDGVTWDKVQRPSGPHGQGHVDQGYTRPVDAILTSPPYENIEEMQDTKWHLTHQGEIPHHTGKADAQRVDHHKENYRGYTRAAQVDELEKTQAELLDLFIDLTMRSQCWEKLLTAQFKQTAALRTTVTNLRNEIRRYVRSQVVVK